MSRIVIISILSHIILISKTGMCMFMPNSIANDCLMKDCNISIIGRCEMYIENYKSILEFNENKIRIRTKNGRIEVLGSHLKITYYYDTDMQIKGLIDEVKLNEVI